MSKKNKVKSAKAGKKSPAKKAIKKASKPTPKKKIAAKTPSNPKKAKKTKVVSVVLKKAVKKTAAKASKPIKKVSGKIIKPISKPKTGAKKTAAKIVKTATKKAAVKVKAIKKVVAKVSKTVSKIIKPAVKTKTSKSKPVAVKKTPAKPVKKAVSAAVSEKERPTPVEKQKKAEEISSKKQLAEKKSNEVLAITNTIPVKEKNEISLSKIASISHSITNPVKTNDSYAVKPEKEPNGKFEMEFVVHASAEMLYEFLSTPSGLSEWFCDDLNIRNGIYTFIWDDQLQQARLLKTVDLQVVRFQWVDKTDGSYFEFKIQRDDLTNDISLIITDFADTVAERESAKLLWHSQVEKLMHVIGSIF